VGVKLHEAAQVCFGERHIEPKTHVQNAKLAWGRHARASSVFTFLCSPLHLLVICRWKIAC